MSEKWQAAGELARRLAEELQQNWRPGGPRPTAVNVSQLVATTRKLAAALPAENRNVGYGTDAECDAISRLRRAVRWLEANIGRRAGADATVWAEGRDLEAVPGWLRADIRRAAETLTPAPPAPREQGRKPEAVHSEDFRSVNWFGTPYSFTPMQAGCVEVLWENWVAGTPEIGEQTILTDHRVESEQTRLSHVFNKGTHPAWGTMIVPGRTKGSFRLASPEKSA